MTQVRYDVNCTYCGRLVSVANPYIDAEIDRILVTIAIATDRYPRPSFAGTESTWLNMACHHCQKTLHIGWYKRLTSQFKRGETPPPRVADNSNSQSGGRNSPVEAGRNVFTEGERKEIRRSLHALEDSLKAEFRLTQEQIATVRGELSELAEASERMTRKDWTNLALGVLASLVMSLVLSPEQTPHFWSLVSGALGWLAGRGGRFMLSGDSL